VVVVVDHTISPDQVQTVDAVAALLVVARLRELEV
jgi:hypothetical protein